MSVKALVTNNTFRLPEDSLRSPFAFTSYSLLLSSLRMSFSYFPKNERKPKISSIIVFFVTIKYCVISAKLLSKPYIWSSILELLFCIITLSSSVLLVTNQSLLHRCLHQSMVNLNFLEDQKRLEQLSRRLTFVSIIFVLVHILLDSVNLFSLDTLNGYFRMNYAGAVVAPNLSPLLLCLAFADIVVKRVVILFPFETTIALFVVLLNAMKNKFKIQNNFFLNNRGLNARTLRKCRINRCDINHIFYQLDQLFSPLVLVFFAFFVLCVAIQTMRFFSEDPAHFLWGHYCAVLFDVVVLFFWFGLVTTEAIALSNSANNCLLSFGKSLCGQKDTECQFFIQAEALFREMSSAELYITGWRYFNVDKSAVLSTLSACFTYLVLILEFNPKIKQNIQKMVF